MTANTQVALLRGINVGRNRRVEMAGLRALLADLGHQGIRTHLNSGNAIFRADTPPDRTERDITAAIAERLGLNVPVLVRTAEELAAVVAADPLHGIATDPARYLVVFLPSEPEPGALADLDPGGFAPEAFRLAGREVYLWCPNGVHRAALPPALAARGLVGTARNWNTVTRLRDLAAEP